MASLDKDALPTEFAIALLEEVGLIPTDEQVRSGESSILKQLKIKKLVGSFQKMAISATLEESMIAFHGYELTEEQNDILSIVYKSTLPWVKGLVVDSCLWALTNRTLGKSEFEAAVKAITEQTQSKTPEKLGKRMQGIMVKITQSEK